MTAQPITFPLTIYYDASCLLCAEEMHTLKKSDSSNRLSLIDCSPEDFDDASARAAGIGRGAMMRRIHARDAAGRWLDGVAVFEVAYRAVGMELVASFWGVPRLQPVWDRIYMWVAGNRMWLSRFGANKAYGYLVRFAARRAEHKRCTEQSVCRVGSTPD